MNHFTKTVQLWLANDQNLYDRATDAARDAFRELVESGEYGAGDIEHLRRDAAEAIGGQISDLLSSLSPALKGVWGDLVSAVFEEIDFDELGEDFLDDSGYLYLTVDGEPAQGDLNAIADSECDLCQALEDSLGELSDEDSSTLWKAKTGEPFVVAGHVYTIKEV